MVERKEGSYVCKGISRKMNIIALLEFELGYFEVAERHLSNYAMFNL